MPSKVVDQWQEALEHTDQYVENILWKGCVQEHLKIKNLQLNQKFKSMRFTTMYVKGVLKWRED